MEDIGQDYLIVTTSSPPSSKALSQESKFPFACILKPFIQNETGIPNVKFPTAELIRCIQCKGYICPYSEFIESGSKWVCNLCKTINIVPTEYFANLDTNGKRIDIDKRLELTHLTIDIIAPESYMSRPPMPCVYVIIIDLSIKAQENDYTAIILNTLTELIEAKAFPGYPRTEIALMFFDKAIHFVSLGSQAPAIYSITDMKDLFLPVPFEELLINIEDLEDKLVNILQISKSMVTVPYSTCYPGALRAAGLVLQTQGGKILSFCGEMFIDTTHPLQFTFKPNTTYFQDLGKELALWNISCTQYIRSSQYCNLQVLIEVSKNSSGQIFFYPHFNSRLSGEKLRNEIIIGILGLTAWESSIKTRTSNEWSIIETFGNYFEKSPDGLLGIPVYNSPQAFVYVMEPRSISYRDMYIQSAMLYTSCDGERKLRIHNKKLTTSDNIKDILENANCNALVNILAKRALKHIIITDKPEEGSIYLEARCKEIVQTCYSI